ncbi:FtsX-like permease family protein, partial [Fulvivirga sp. RKSG066]|uniref:FtsX-like permease family protein n=1 Tax=Fulvivirga aurantia TaxID=2529383 RepID=UPI0012BC7B5E
MHHDSRYPTLVGRVATYDELNLLAVIGVLLLVAACINFINLNTALAVKRSKEIGIRKVLGSDRSKLIFQYLGETAMITLVACGISLGVAELMHLNLQSIIGYEIPEFTYDLSFGLFMVALFVTVSILSGLYPALIISGYRPIQALRKTQPVRSAGFSMRRGLIVFQLLIAQVLVIAVIVVVQQLDHFMTRPSGFDSEAVVQFSVPRPDEIDIDAFSDRLKRINGVEAVSLSSTGTASSNQWGATVRFTSNGEEQIENFRVKIIDEDFLETFRIPLLNGRNVKKDTNRFYLLNETALREMSVADPDEVLGQKISAWGKEGEVIGVIKDFKTVSLHSQQQPVVLWYEAKMFFLGSVKLKGDGLQETIAEIQREWQHYFPEFTFSYEFLDQKMAQFYEDERRLAKTFSLFAGLAIVIGAIGLLGLISFSINQKTKEIGVRKILGASLAQVMYLLSFDFVRLVIIAFAIAAPLSWYVMEHWLNEFATRITLNFWIFMAGLSFTLFITIMIISFKSVRAALANPVD